MDISVILVSRGRWESLKKTLRSLTESKDPDVEIIVGLDDDDKSIGDLSELNEFPGVRVSVNPRQPSVGALFNLLQKQATGNWFIPFPDDYVMKTVDWAERLRNAVSFMPSGLGVAYLADQLYRGFSTFPVISKRTIEINGFFMPAFFPFLFGDTWWNEVGNLCGVKQPIDAQVVIEIDHGNEHKLRDMVLWSSVFEITRPMRTDTAIKILNEIYKDCDSEADWLISTMPSRVELCEHGQKHMFEPEFLKKWDNTDPNPPSERYLSLKAVAEDMLYQFPLNHTESMNEQQ